MRLWRSITSTFFGSKSLPQVQYVADIVRRYWRAINWDFQHVLNVNALDFFSAPCACGQCRVRYGLRGASRRTWDQFVSFYEDLLSWRGSYTQAMYLSDPEVIEAQVAAPADEWVSSKPGLWGWTKEMDALYFVADQVQAGRVRDADSFKPYPRPVIPADVERRKRKDTKVSSGIEAAQERGRKAAEARRS